MAAMRKCRFVSGSSLALEYTSISILDVQAKVMEWVQPWVSRDVHRAGSS